ncbi:GNAT family N-acetyltransferase [Butyrivibrio sp. MC2021]|uniref:GNAT family N-acetyltransferase n=1 Tax=Butyrivibrio sp. MC2021 TaxID=1408306 RepID=UPI00047E20ED|nr:GNAT family N-acetyltransferase [Butyrivibrio sp. MC2021]
MNKIGTKTIETDSLILRQFTIEDAHDMFSNWASDPEVTKYLTWPAHQDEAFTKTLLSEWIENYQDGTYFNWAMELKDTSAVIGNISVVHLDEKIEGAEIGYCMSRACWGKELMPEALKAVMNFLFDEVGLNLVAAYHDSRNPKSGRVMDKAGMKYEGTLRAAAINNQGISDRVYHAMIRSDRL